MPEIGTLCLPVAWPTGRARPFLKWTGGKQWLAAAGRSLLPADFDGRYFEPFLGGGSLFFSIAPERATLSDVNEVLVTTYQAVRDDVESVIRKLQTYPYSPAFYETLKHENPRDPAGAAARLIYLNKTSFNGIYRVNASGTFNVPFGRYVNPTICQEDRLRAAAEALIGVRLAVRDFGRSAGIVRTGDFLYLDPPFITGHTNNGFVKYNASLFAWPDQERLARIARQARARGAFVALSNAYHESVLGLYPDFHIYPCSRRSTVGVGDSRGRITEALITSYELPDELLGGVT